MRWLLLVLLLAFNLARAQTLESALMPGAVIQGHAEAEHECAKCHVRGDRAAQPGLCLDCHKPVAADIKAGSGYHGRLREAGKAQDKNIACRSCHTEHKGREAKIVKLDPQRFDHSQTDFALKGKHQGKKCDSCHRSGEPYRKAPGDCVACHRKDDQDKGHKGGLGEKCANCHQENNWKDARFDHGKTRFALKLSHADADCADCHKDRRYVDTPRECVACHRKDDQEKGHKGAYGNTCEKCHNEGEWKQPTFRHDRDTRFPLLDKHRPVKCESCHRASPFREKLQTRCVACHRGDDAHKGSLGDKCEKCHAAKGWKETRFDHDADTKFPLKDKHAQAKCQSCHKDSNGAESIEEGTKKNQQPPHPSPLPQGERESSCDAPCNGFPLPLWERDKVRGSGPQPMTKTRAPTPTECVACHRKDDQEKGHKGSFGEKCDSCHSAKGFKFGRFDHDRETHFKLLNKHAKAKCSACHRTPLYTTQTDKRCVACHDKDDVHFASYGTDCERCHVADDWRKIIKQDADGK